MENKPSYTTNGRLTALDGSYYRISAPYVSRVRPAHLGEINYRWLCIECREQIPRELKGMYCSDLCKRTHKVSIG